VTQIVGAVIEVTTEDKFEWSRTRVDGIEVPINIRARIILRDGRLAFLSTCVGKRILYDDDTSEFISGPMNSGTCPWVDDNAEPLIQMADVLEIKGQIVQKTSKNHNTYHVISRAKLQYMARPGRTQRA